MEMEVNVSMTAEDFMKFMEWKRDKVAKEGEIRELGDNVEKLMNKVVAALEACGDDEYKIKDQHAAADLYMSVTEGF